MTSPKTKALRAGDFEGYLMWFGSHERLAAFYKIKNRLPDGDYWRLLAEVWLMSEVIEPNTRVWLRLFSSSRPQREMLMTKREHDALARLPGTLEIWRGFGSKRGWRGMSWTVKKSVAKRFAEYACGRRRAFLAPACLGNSPQVVGARCDKANVLAYFEGRNEAEIIINPKDVYTPTESEAAK